MKSCPLSAKLHKGDSNRDPEHGAKSVDFHVDDISSTTDLKDSSKCLGTELRHWSVESSLAREASYSYALVMIMTYGMPSMAPDGIQYISAQTGSDCAGDDDKSSL
nr:hypothetical protein CFP56_63802 [Quercus suber]